MYRKRRRVRVYHEMGQRQCRPKRTQRKKKRTMNAMMGESLVRMWKTRADALERSVDAGVVGGIGILSQDGCELRETRAEGAERTYHHP
jgi:hypothetical protein